MLEKLVSAASGDKEEKMWEEVTFLKYIRVVRDKKSTNCGRWQKQFNLPAKGVY